MDILIHYNTYSTILVSILSPYSTYELFVEYYDADVFIIDCFSERNLS